MIQGKGILIAQYARRTWRLKGRHATLTASGALNWSILLEMSAFGTKRTFRD